MRRLIAIFAARPVTAGAFIVALLTLAALVLTQLPLEELPPLPVRAILIEARAPALAAEELTAALALPLEDSMASLDGVEGMETVLRDGSVHLRLTLKWGSNPQDCLHRTRAVLDRVYASLPASFERPRAVLEEDIGGAFLFASLRVAGSDPFHAARLARSDILPSLRALPGLALVRLTGAPGKEFRVEAEADRLLALGLDHWRLSELLASHCMDVPAGMIRDGERELPLVLAARPDSLEGIASCMLPTGDGLALPLSAVAKLGEGAAPLIEFFADAEGSGCGLSLHRSPGSDPARLSRNVRMIFSEISRRHGGTVTFDILEDRSVSLVERTRELGLSAFAGMVSVVLVFWLSAGRGKKGRLKSAFLAALALPVSVSSAVLVLGLFSRSLNAMSLGGMALGVGMVADTAILVLDVIAGRGAVPVKSGPLEGSLHRVLSVYPSSLTGLLTTLIVFAPLVLVSGPLGGIYGDLVLSLVPALCAGWLYAFFALPALSGGLAGKAEGVDGRPGRCAPAGTLAPAERPCNAEPRWLSSVEAAYRRAMELLFRRPAPFVASTLVAALLSLGFFIHGGLSFMPTDRLERVRFDVQWPAGTPLERLAEQAPMLCRTLEAHAAVDRAWVQGGAGEDSFSLRGDPGWREARMSITCRAGTGKDLSPIVDELLALLTSAVPGRVIEATRAKNPLEYALSPSGAPSMVPLVDNRRALVEKSGGNALPDDGIRELVRIRPLRGWFPGLTTADLGRSLESLCEGADSFSVDEDGTLIPVRVVSGKRISRDALVQGLQIAGNDGRPLALSSLMELSLDAGPELLVRRDRVASSPGNDVQGDGGLAPGGEGETVFDLWGRELIALALLTLVLLWLLLVAWFQSLRIPLLILSILPLQVVLSAPFLALGGFGLDSGSLLGLVVLAGTGVNAALILWEETVSSSALNADDSGCSPGAFILEAAVRRLRPVLLAALTTVVALVPLALAGGSALQRSMSLALLGGTLASCVPGYLLLPLVFRRALPASRGAGK